MGSSCCSRPAESNEEIQNTNSNIQQQVSHENIDQNQNEILLQNDQLLKDIQEYQKQIQDKNKIKDIPSTDNNEQIQEQKYQKEQLSSYQEQSKSDTPKFNEQNINLKRETDSQMESNNIVFIGDTTQDIINKQKRSSKCSAGSPIRIFISRNSLKKMTQDLNRLRAIPEINTNKEYLKVDQTLEEMKNDEEDLRRKASKKLSRSFSQVQKEDEEQSISKNRYNSCDSDYSQKKSCLKKELKYSKFKKTKTLNNNDKQSQKGTQVDQKKKVRFEKSVLKKQRSKKFK